MVVIKPVLADTSVITVTMYRMLFSAFVLILLGLYKGNIFIWAKTLKDKKYNCQLLGTFTLATIGGFWLSLAAIKHCQIIIASSLMSLEPLFILIFMIIFNKYIPKKKEVFGLISVFTGILLLCIG